jgi:hypothetical protein
VRAMEASAEVAQWALRSTGRDPGFVWMLNQVQHACEALRLE